jgi:AAA+ superfamily predicted ATPase
MKEAVKNLLLTKIQNIYEISKNSELDIKIISSLKTDLKIVGSYLNVEPREALFFSIILNINFDGDNAYFKDLYRHFKIPSIKMISEMEYIDNLVTKGYLVKKSGRDRNNEIHTNKYFMVKSKLSKAIVKGLPCPVFDSYTIDTTTDLLEKIYEQISARIEDNTSIEELNIETTKLVNEFPDFLFFNSLKKFELSFEETIFYYYIVWKSILGMQGVSPIPLVNSITDSSRESVKFTQGLYNGVNALISNDLLESRNSGFLNDIEFFITDKSIELLATDSIMVSSGTISNNNTIKAETISAKILFYNENENEQLRNLQGLLMEEKYANLKERLNSKNLPLSLNVLLFGSPGTGKTESVLQLAKSSGREIIKVDISSTKSKWFGESEKLIKNIFTDYKEYSKKCDLTPILLFNEADAILSKRATKTDSATQKTENAIQNILLEELENFEGIFFATTNLAQNLDAAFDRRFLYKVEFNKPELGQRIAIWESKLPDLTRDDYEKLAAKFEFSGGQIENIVRKCEINQVLYNTLPSFETIESFCLSENNEHVKNGIGFMQK